MKKMFVALAMGLMMLGMGTSAHAIGVGVKAGTLGLGAELGLTLSDRFTTRLALNKYKFNADQTIDGIDYSADLDMSSSAIFLDWSPFTNGSLHLTVGYVNSDNKLSATATPVGTVNIGGTDYDGSTLDFNLNSTVKLGSGPYFGIGYGNVPATGFGFTFELGVVQMGAPKADISVTGTDRNLINQSDVDQEEKNMQDDLNQFELYPVVSAGISIGF